MIVVAKLTARKGEEDNLEKALREIIPFVAKEEGTLAYTLHRSKKDPCQFLFYEKYRDGLALKSHGETEHFKALGLKLKSLLAGPFEVEMYEEIDGIPVKK